MTTATPTPKRHWGGVIVVSILAVLFFVLIGLVLLSGGHRRAAGGNGESETMTVLPPSIRLRTEPNAKAPVVATATSGENLVRVEDHGPWVRVQNGDGLVGWAERSTLERTAERERRLARFEAIRKLPSLRGVVQKTTSLYAGPGIFYPIVGELHQAEKVQVFTRDHDFYAVGVGNEIAYADIDAIDVSASGGPQFAVRTTPAPTAEPTVPANETMEPEPPSEPEPVAPPPPAAAEPEAAVRGGVYAAVPPGGTQPEEIERVIPRYPAAARAAGAGGPVVIRGIVRRDGTIDDVEVIRDLPYGLGDAARRAVEQWRFRPATWRGQPIDVYYTVTVNFRMQ